MKLIARFLLLLALSTLTRAALADDGKLPSTAGSFLQMIFGLVIVLGALFAGLHLLRRLQNGRTQLVGNLRIVGATSVGPRERVVLLSVGSKVLVLGVTPGEISALHTMEASELPLTPPENKTPSNDFASRLRQFMEKRNAR